MDANEGVSRADAAERLFRGGSNCAQSVLTAFCPLTGLEENWAKSIASGFGAGMARLQGTCGAVTAAYMVFGLEMSKRAVGHEAIRDRTYGAVRKFERRFAERFGATDCARLLGCDLNGAEGQKEYKERGLKESVCLPCIRYSAALVEALLGEDEAGSDSAGQR